jgi:hypothetical protein
LAPDVVLSESETVGAVFMIEVISVVQLRIYE